MNIVTPKTALALCLSTLGILTLIGACSATSNDDPRPSSANGSASGSGGAGGQGGDGPGSGGNFNLTSNGGTGGGSIPCEPTPDNDFDQDGFSINEGDCNDCDPNTNPNAIEVPTKNGTPQDEDCDMEVDEVVTFDPCDQGLAIDDADPLSTAKAVGLCKMSTGPKDWGVVSAQWTLADGSPAPDVANFHIGHGLLDSFGPNLSVREGERMLALSSGSARTPNDGGYKDVQGFDKMYITNHPSGFPKESPACPGVTTGEPHDAAAVELTIRTPGNAHGFAFDFDFYTFEWPDFVCSSYNDFFVAILSPIPMGQTDGNISFDSQNNPVSVNNAFVEVWGCPGNPPNPCTAGMKSYTCALGNVELIGTGFGFDTTGAQDHAATSWLSTVAPITPNSEITIRWAVYDSGDGILDSTTLIDNWRWVLKPGTKVSTEPVPK